MNMHPISKQRSLQVGSSVSSSGQKLAGSLVILGYQEFENDTQVAIDSTIAAYGMA
jgi:hypothetical protein